MQFGATRDLYHCILVATNVNRNRQQFGFGLTSLTMSKPDRLSLNRFGSFQTRTEPVWLEPCRTKFELASSRSELAHRLKWFQNMV